MNLTPERQAWLVQHIPHRIRATIAGTPLLVELLDARLGPGSGWPEPIPALETEGESVKFHCWGNAIWEGRMSAARWLVDFVGITATRKGPPGRPTSRLHDWRIDKLGAPLFPLTDPAAKKLADVWLGCTKATSHPTEGSNHPPVDEGELNAAVRIVLKYLDEHLYQPTGISFADVVLTPHPQDKRWRIATAIE